MVPGDHRTLRNRYPVRDFHPSADGSGRGGGKGDDLKAFSIPAGPAETTLRTFSDQSGRSVMFAPEKVKGVTTNAVKGDLAVSEAIDQLLAGTNLSAVPETRNGGFAIRRLKHTNSLEKNVANRSASDRAADVTDDKKVELPVFEVMGSKLLNMDT